MGQYIQTDDIYNYEVYGLSNSIVPSATVAQFITDAEALVDGILANLYTVPFTSTAVPPLVKKVTRDFVGYELLNYLHSKMNRNVNNNVIKNYEISQAIIKDVVDGKTNIFFNGTQIAQRTDGDFGATYHDMPTMVNMDDERSWRVPGQLNTQIDSKRRGSD